MANLALSGYFPPDRVTFFEVLAKSLAQRSLLKAHSEGIYPGADLVISYEWEGQRCGYRLRPEAFLKWSPHYLAHLVQRSLSKTALSKLYAAGARQGDRHTSSAVDTVVSAGLHRRPRRRR